MLKCRQADEKEVMSALLYRLMLAPTSNSAFTICVSGSLLERGIRGGAGSTGADLVLLGVVALSG
jgi:hypothetical protein